MTMKQLARLLEASESMTPTQAVTFLSREIGRFEDKQILFSILSLELAPNNIGLAKAKKWMAKIYDVFEDEIDVEYDTYGDLGEAMYWFDNSQKDNKYTIKTLKTLLELDCSNMTSNSFALIEEHLLNMSDNEVKWFIRYWLRTPRNGIQSTTLKKVLAKHYGKKIADVKKHCNFNSMTDVISYYEMNEEPPMNLTHGAFVSPMLAKAIPMNKWPTNKIVDFKYDGNRYQIHKQDDSVIIFNRTGKIVTDQFSDVAEIVRNYEVNNLILDGEIYPVENGLPAPHSKLATRVHSKDKAEAISKCPVKWVIFDCLMYKGVTIMNLPYSQRLIEMNTLPDQAERSTTDVMAFYNKAINEGFEGIIVKDAKAPYESGKRSKYWAKYKPPLIDLDVVIVSAKYGDGKNSNVFATFEIAVKSDNGFTSVGWCGSGFTDTQLINLTSNLRKNVESFKDGTYNFLPRIVLEIRADLVSKDAKGNLSLRFPRCKRIREDKFVNDIDTLKRMEELQ